MATHRSRPSPNVTGMKKNSTGICLVKNTFWLMGYKSAPVQLYHSMI